MPTLLSMYVRIGVPREKGTEKSVVKLELHKVERGYNSNTTCTLNAKARIKLCFQIIA